MAPERSQSLRAFSKIAFINKRALINLESAQVLLDAVRVPKRVSFLDTVEKKRLPSKKLV